MGYGVVRVWWLVNSLIHNHHRLCFYHKDLNGEYIFWCEQFDDIYNTNDKDIDNREIYFITVLEDEIKVYLREK